MGVQIKDFLKARRDRALGSVMGHAERNFYDQLSVDQQREFRAVVIDALNSYHDSVLDLVKSDLGSVRNEEVAGLLERVDRHLAAQQRPVR